MSLKSFIVPRLIERMLSHEALLSERYKSEQTRKKSGAPHVVEFFHDPADPYSQLLKSVLPEFEQRYDIELKTHIVGPPDDGAAPEREALNTYAKLDAARLAENAGIDFTFQDTPPATDTADADARRDKLGHYLGGTLYYGGEWYWGLDRLHYLEDRLADLDLGTPDAPIYAPLNIPSDQAKKALTPPPELHFFASFRSPYTAIVADRVKALAEAYGAEIKLRFVLPMVMRSLPVPKNKREYIIRDTAREAHRLGVPYGRICDPVGRPVEHSYSLLPWAREQGRDIAFMSSFFTHVWSKGVDARSDKGMRKIVEAAGLDWSEAKSIIGNDDWHAEAEANRLEMMSYGIWGVPCFRIGDVITWGQDRLWVIEDELKRLTKT